MAFTSPYVGERPADTYPPEVEERSTSTPSPEPEKPSLPSLDKRFADLMLSAPNKDLTGPWVMKAENTADAGCVYRWGKLLNCAEN
jgi:hypothetical protein